MAKHESSGAKGGDIIAGVNGYRKIAFGPGKDFDSEASNTDT